MKTNFKIPIKGTSLVEYDLLSIFNEETIQITEISPKSGVKWIENENIVYQSRKSFEIYRNIGSYTTILNTIKNIEDHGQTAFEDEKFLDAVE